MNQHELNLESPVFIELRHKLDIEINDIIGKMITKDLHEGSVTAKIKIGIVRAQDENGEIHTTAIFEPKVTGKIGSSYEDKCGATGGRVQIGEDGEVVIGTKQVTVDEIMDGKKGA